MRQRRGFTLLEILIVVAILAVMLLLLFPAFRFARIAAARARCLSNIKQITLALSQYSVNTGGKLPPGTSSSPPFGAMNPTASAKYLNSYLSGDGYRALECPADQGGSPGSEFSYFEKDGFSYRYIGTDGLSSEGISNICGSVSWQEAAMGELPQLNIEAFRSAMGYYSNGPEEQPDPNLRSRDITRDEIDNVAWPKVKDALAGMQGQQGFNINSEQLRWWKEINSGDSDNIPGDNTKFKWRDQYNAATGMPIGVGSRTSSKWNRVNPWARTTYNYDYWRQASKKVAVLDRDASLSFNTPGTNSTSVNDRYPLRGKGFWHEYPYVPDPKEPTNMAKYRVQVHAGFLDGSARVIEVNKYSNIDRDSNDYY